MMLCKMSRSLLVIHLDRGGGLDEQRGLRRRGLIAGPVLLYHYSHWKTDHRSLNILSRLNISPSLAFVVYKAISQL